jgi:hypothetical protein
VGWVQHHIHMYNIYVNRVVLVILSAMGVALSKFDLMSNGGCKASCEIMLIKLPSRENNAQ